MWKPILFKRVNLILGSEATGTDFACQSRSVTLNPEAQTTRVKTLCEAGQFSDVDDPEWELQIGYLYGRDDADPNKALADYLLANHGEKVPFFFAPIAGGAGYTGELTLIAGAIGGEQGNYGEQTVNLPLDGQPAPWAGLGGS